MDQQEGMYSNIAPMFKGDDYAFWSVRMKIYLMSMGCDIWQSVEDGYTAPPTTPTEIVGKKLCNDNARASNGILGGLSKPIFVKVMYCKLEK